jgi:hypothetical protein
MKRFIRYLVFSSISFYLIYLLYFPFVVNDKKLGLFYIFGIVLGTSLFSRVIVKAIKLPSSGLIFLLLNTFIHTLTIYLGSIYLKKFNFEALNFNKMEVFDIITVPTVFLERYTSLVMFSALYCIIFGFLYYISWTSQHKK